MNPERKRETTHLIRRAMADGRYARAEKLFQPLLLSAFESKDKKIISIVAKAWMECRRLHALEVLHILKQIDPLQSQRKALS